MAKLDSNRNPIGKSRGLKRGTTAVADWASADADALRSAICAAAIVGGALRFGYTSDGGAYALGIYGDGAPYTEYVSPADDIDITLVAVRELFEDIANDLATKENPK